MIGDPHSTGELDAKLEARLAAVFVAEALQLLHAALEDWKARGFPRWSDHEVPCTTVVHGRLTEMVERRDPLAAAPVWVEYESPELTEDQLGGRADPATAGRRDLVLYFGRTRSARFPIECKRLDGRANGAAYVSDGILRFVRLHYGAPLDAAAMVGYVMSRSVEDRVVEINAAVTSHPELGPAHVLRTAPEVPAGDHPHRSEHRLQQPRSITLTHFFIDMRARPPATSR
jgi:hypothetical protein